MRRLFTASTFSCADLTIRLKCSVMLVTPFSVLPKARQTNNSATKLSAAPTLRQCNSSSSSMQGVCVCVWGGGFRASFVQAHPYDGNGLSRTHHPHNLDGSRSDAGWLRRLTAARAQSGTLCPREGHGGLGTGAGYVACTALPGSWIAPQPVPASKGGGRRMGGVEGGKGGWERGV
jgi:hypothetical protein